MAGRVSVRVLDALVAITAVLSALTLFAVIWLAVPALPPLPSGVLAAGFLGAFAMIVTSTRVSRRVAEQGVAGRPFMAGHGRLILIVAAAMFAALVVIVIVVNSIGGEPWPAGAPIIVDGHYYLKLSEGITPITASEYRQDHKSSMQMFLCVFLFFDLAALTSLGWTGRSLAAGR